MPAPSESAPSLEPIRPALASLGVRLSAAEESAILALVALLERWNRRINLTATRSREQILVRHVLDSLAAEALPWPRLPSGEAGPLLAADVGSGAGLPGLLLALRHPEWRWTLLETVAKKVTFQDEAVRTLGLRNVEPLRQDVHAFAQGAGAARFRLVTARAFAPLAELLPLAARLLAPGGELWAYKGAQAAQEEAAVAPEALAQFEPVRRHPYRFDALDWGGVILAYRRR